MICQPCKNRKHEECPSKKAAENSTKSMAISEAGVSIQLSGLCPCQHKVKLMSEISLEEAEAKVRSGFSQECGCGGSVSAPAGEPEGDIAKFIQLWFEDHSYEDLSKHGLRVREANDRMMGVV